MNKFKSNNEGRCPIYSVQLIERAIEEEFPIHTKQVGQTGNKNLEDKEISSALFKTSKPVDNGDPAIVKVSRQLHEPDKHFKEKDKGDKIVCKKLKRNTASSRGREENTEIPLTYIGMIAQAISSSREKRLVLSDIYRYMQRSFFHYLCNKPRWKNTVRHNLSYHDCFVKRESSKGTKRSHYWIIHPDYVEQFNRENYNKELDDVPTSSISETDRRPSPGQQVSFINYGHLQPHASVATSDFSRPPPPRELTFAEYERAIQAPPIPNGECLIPFMPPRSHTECYMQQFAMPAYSHQSPLNFHHAGLDQRRQYPYQQFVPDNGEFNSLKTPTTCSMGHTQEFSENYPR